MGINACSDCAANNSSNSIISEDLLEQERKIEITTDTTVSNITCTEDYDNDNGDNNDDNDQSKRKDQIPGVSTSPSKITGMLVDNGLTKLGIACFFGDKSLPVILPLVEILKGANFFILLIIADGFYISFITNV